MKRFVIKRNTYAILLIYNKNRRKLISVFNKATAMKFDCHSVNTPNGFTAATMKAKRVDLSLFTSLSIYRLLFRSHPWCVKVITQSFRLSLSDPFVITLDFSVFLWVLLRKEGFSRLPHTFLLLFFVNIHFHILYIYIICI